MLRAMDDVAPRKPPPRSALVLGAGAIGVGLATVLADAGVEVALVEPDPDRRAAVRAEIVRRHAPMAQAGFARGGPTAAAERVEPLASAGAALAAADLVLEAGPEALEVKRAIFAALLAGARPHAPIASASSALTVSMILENPADRARCLVAHPLNPPTLLRVVEIVPAPETRPAVVDAAIGLLAGAGFAPVLLGAEKRGFAFNRLQGALLREAFRLVAEGVADADGLDRLVRDGLGPRWALSGPFETAELNTPGGIAAHAARMGPAYRAMGEERGERDVEWSTALVAEIERQRRAILPADRLPARVAWRETALARLLAARRDILDDAP
jgi:3-hydroxyacyl-CoA dehydrogenase